jgi:hypothetical protein
MNHRHLNIIGIIKVTGVAVSLLLRLLVVRTRLLGLIMR